MSDKRYQDKQLKGEDDSKKDDDDDSKKKDIQTDKSEVEKKLEKNNVFYDGRWSEEKKEEQLKRYKNGGLIKFHFNRPEYEGETIYAEKHNEAVKVFNKIKTQI
jgi:hypothetical protein